MFILVLRKELKLGRKLVRYNFLSVLVSHSLYALNYALTVPRNTNSHKRSLDVNEEDILLTIIRRHGSLSDITLLKSWHEAFLRQKTFDSSTSSSDTKTSAHIESLASLFSTSKELLRFVSCLPSFLASPILTQS